MSMPCGWKFRGARSPACPGASSRFSRPLAVCLWIVFLVFVVFPFSLAPAIRLGEFLGLNSGFVDGLRFLLGWIADWSDLTHYLVTWYAELWGVDWHLMLM